MAQIQKKIKPKTDIPSKIKAARLKVESGSVGIIRVGNLNIIWPILAEKAVEVHIFSGMFFDKKNRSRVTCRLR